MSCLGANYNPKIKRTWSRLDSPCIFSESYVDNSVINKQKVLNYPKNSSNFTQREIYSLICNGKWINKNKTWATQSTTYTNPNINNLELVNGNTLICPQNRDGIITSFTNQNINILNLVNNNNNNLINPMLSYCVFKLIWKNKLPETLDYSHLPVIQNPNKLKIKITTRVVNKLSVIVYMDYQVLSSIDGVGIGFSEESLTYYNNNIDTIDFLRFGGFPLYDGGSQFNSLQTKLFFNAKDTPTINDNTSFRGMFANMPNFNTNVNFINNWNMTNISDITSMFYNSVSFNNGSLTNDGLNPLSLNKLVENCVSQDFISIFEGATSFNQNIMFGSFSYAINIQSLFKNAVAFNNGSIVNDTANPLEFIINNNTIISLAELFKFASSFNQQVVLKDANNNVMTTLTNVNDIHSIFAGCSIFNNGNMPGETTYPLNWIFSQYPNLNYAYYDIESPAFNIYNKPLQISERIYCSFKVVGKNGSLINGTLEYLPVIQNTSKITIQSLTEIVDSNTLIIYIYYKVISSTAGTGGVGIGFSTEALTYYNNHIDIIDFLQFGDFPLYDGGFQFNGLNAKLFFTATDSPTINENTSFESMFANMPNFNTNVNFINNWNVENITNIRSMFSHSSSFNNGSLTNDGLNPLLLNNVMALSQVVSDTTYVFSYATEFNQNVLLPPLTRSTNISLLFLYAENFNNGSIRDDGANPLELIINNDILTVFQQNFAAARVFNQQIILKDVNNNIITTLPNVNTIYGFFTVAYAFNNGNMPGETSYPLNWIFSQYPNLNYNYYDYETRNWDNANKPPQLKL